MDFIKEYKHEFLGLVYAGGVILLWYGTSLAIEKAILNEQLSKVADLIIVGVGAYLGAFFAFKLSKIEKQRDKTQNEVATVRSNLFLLGLQINDLVTLRSHYEPFKNDRRRFYLATATTVNFGQGKRIAFSDLDFLVGAGYPNEIFRLTLIQDQLDAITFLVDEIRRIFLTEVTPKLEAHGQIQGFPTEAEFEAIVGTRNSNFLKNYSDQLYERLYYSIAEGHEIYATLRRLAAHRYPGYQFHAEAEANS